MEVSKIKIEIKPFTDENGYTHTPSYEFENINDAIEWLKNNAKKQQITIITTTITEEQR